MSVLPTLANKVSNNTSFFSGIQIAPQSLLDEGIDYCLDFLQEKGAINTLMLNPYTFYGGMGRPLELLADHGVPKEDNSKRMLPHTWVRHDPNHFTDTAIKYPQNDQVMAYASVDFFKEISRPLKERNMKLYVRLYE